MIKLRVHAVFERNAYAVGKIPDQPRNIIECDKSTPPDLHPVRRLVRMNQPIYALRPVKCPGYLPKMHFRLRLGGERLVLHALGHAFRSTAESAHGLDETVSAVLAGICGKSVRHRAYFCHRHIKTGRNITAPYPLRNAPRATVGNVFVFQVPTGDEGGKEIKEAFRTFAV